MQTNCCNVLSELHNEIFYWSELIKQKQTNFYRKTYAQNTKIRTSKNVSCSCK